MLMKAEIHIGEVKKTANQRKKHYTQFTKREKMILANAINRISVNQLWSSTHLKEKDAVTYSYMDIKNVLSNNNIIEYNITKKGSNYYDKRVVLRGVKAVETNKGAMNLCVVISLKNKAIVTVYYCSSIKETHIKIDMDRYNKNLKIEI